MKRGRFIVFEGLDGSGHTTQLYELHTYLTELTIPHIITREPTHESEAGKRALAVLQHKERCGPAELQQLFIEDRDWHVKNFIVPHLERGISVLSDRYLHSTVAFGSIDLPLKWLVILNAEFPNPDATFIFDVRPEICLERIAARGKETELFEKLGKLRRAATTYRSLANRYANVHILDGERPITNIAVDVCTIAAPLFSQAASRAG